MNFLKYLTEDEEDDIVILTPEMLGKQFSLQDRKQKYIVSGKTVYLKYGKTPTTSDYEEKAEWIPSKGQYVVYYRNKKIGTSIDRIDLSKKPPKEFIESGLTNLEKKWPIFLHMNIWGIISDYKHTLP